MRKHDIPQVGRPPLYYALNAFLLLGYILLLLFVPDVRPGVLEAMLGTAVGGLAGMVLCHEWMAYIRCLGPEVHRHPWVGWASIVAYPVPPVGRDIRYRIVLLLVLFGSFLAVAVVVSFLRRLFPGLEWPWSRFGYAGDDVFPFTSLPATMALYLVVTHAIISIKVVSWFRRLPD